MTGFTHCVPVFYNRGSKTSEQVPIVDIYGNEPVLLERFCHYSCLSLLVNNHPNIFQNVKENRNVFLTEKYFVDLIKPLKCFLTRKKLSRTDPFKILT